eukprot:COSAG01_NODE_59974_length_297_cov_0.757576_1_plen_49_part_10
MFLGGKFGVSVVCTLLRAPGERESGGPRSIQGQSREQWYLAGVSFAASA